jgi:hypothetical protein
VEQRDRSDKKPRNRKITESLCGPALEHIPAQRAGRDALPIDPHQHVRWSLLVQHLLIESAFRRVRRSTSTEHYGDATPDAPECSYHRRRYTGLAGGGCGRGSRGSASLPAQRLQSRHGAHGSFVLFTVIGGCSIGSEMQQNLISPMSFPATRTASQEQSGWNTHAMSAFSFTLTSLLNLGHLDE